MTVVEDTGVKPATEQPAVAQESAVDRPGDFISAFKEELKAEPRQPVPADFDDEQPTTARPQAFEDTTDDEPLMGQDAPEKEIDPVPYKRFNKVIEERNTLEARAKDLDEQLKRTQAAEAAIKALGFNSVEDFNAAAEAQREAQVQQDAAQALQTEFEMRENRFGTENAEEWKEMRLEAVKTQQMLKRLEAREQQFTQRQQLEQGRAVVQSEYEKVAKMIPEAGHLKLQEIYAAATPQYAPKLTQTLTELIEGLVNDTKVEYATSKDKAKRTPAPAGTAATAGAPSARSAYKPGRGVGAVLMDWINPTSQ